MKLALATIIALPILLCSISNSAQDSNKSAGSTAYFRFQQIYRTRPVRLDGPLREENISDEEVREIEAVMIEHFPGTIVNIGGVTGGCPCEDGLSCNSQVWVVAHRADRSNGLMLSKIADHWTIGPLQKWWFRSDRLWSLMRTARQKKAPDYLETYRKLQEQQNQLQQEFPSCGPQA